MSADHLKYQLEDMLGRGFGNLDHWQEYQELKTRYEDITGDRQFSILELEGRLNILINDHDNYDFPDLPEPLFREYMHVVGRLYLIKPTSAMRYLELLKD